MKILILNGSPRKGNTVTAINALIEGMGEGHEIDVVNTTTLKVAPCKGCDACGCTKGCIDKDDTHEIVDKFVDSDFVVFATPVYWWGITAQLKLVIDKLYSKGAHIKNKKIGLFLVGEEENLDADQYAIIKTQFDCICNYLGWDMKFYLKYSAYGKDDLKKQEAALSELKATGEAVVK